MNSQQTHVPQIQNPTPREPQLHLRARLLAGRIITALLCLATIGVLFATVLSERA